MPAIHGCQAKESMDCWLMFAARNARRALHKNSYVVVLSCGFGDCVERMAVNPKAPDPLNYRTNPDLRRLGGPLRTVR